MARGRCIGAVAGAVLLFGAALVAQFGGGQLPRGFFGFEREPRVSNPTYDGRFTFARLKYASGPGGYYYCGLPAWAHGYASCRGGARAEESLMQIMTEISYLNPRVEE